MGGKRDKVERLSVRRWSGQAEAIFGYSEAEMIGKQWDELAVFGSTDVEITNASAKDLVHGVKPRNVVTLRNHTRGGSLRVCRWYNSALFLRERRRSDRTLADRGHHRAGRGGRAHPSPCPSRCPHRSPQPPPAAGPPRARPWRAPAAPGSALPSCCWTSTTVKSVNDTLGHQSGDELIRLVAERMQDLVRGSDTVARLGGDEFSIVQTNLREAAGAAILAEKIMAAVRERCDLNGRQPRLGASIGIALFQEDADAPEALFEHADIALYRAKAEGRTGTPSSSPR